MNAAAKRPTRSSSGFLALDSGKRLPLQVLSSAAGWYLGTADESGPYSRESLEHWPAEYQAHAALASGDWTQRDEP